MRHWTRAAALAAALAFAVGHAGAEELRREDALHEAHAVLLGLATDGEKPGHDGAADIYYSIIDNPDAPRLVTRLELALDPCRSRTISALQFPGRWANLTLTITDLGRIAAVAAYASVDDMIAERSAIAFDDPRAEQVVLTGEGVSCMSRLSLAGESQSKPTSCGDRLDLSMTDDEQRVRGLRALAAVAVLCKVAVLQPKPD